MPHRRAFLSGLSGLWLAGVTPARAAAATATRSYRGKIRYAAGDRENGREYFSVTIQADGVRTLRAQCEMDDDHLLREVTITVDAQWRPLTAFVQVTVQDRLVGSTWFRFTDDAAIAEGFTAAEGRISQKLPLDHHVESFVAHPIHQDAWHLARIRRAGGRSAGAPEFISSLAPNGASGPTLVPFPKGYMVFDLVGPERIKTAAGEFAAEHFTTTIVPKQRTMEVWAAGEDCLPIRMTSPGHSYDLVELSGDPR